MDGGKKKITNLDKNLKSASKDTPKSKTKSTTKTDSFIKRLDSYIQIYTNNIYKKTKQNKKFLYIYRKNINKICYENNKLLDEIQEIKIYENDEFPEYLVLNTYGYMFIKPDVKKREIPILPEVPIQEYKTNFMDFNNRFDKNINTNTFIKLSPCVSFNESHPKIVFEHDYLLNINQNNHLQTKEILNQFQLKNNETNINNSKEWFEYIKKNCPFSSIFNLPFKYYSKINDSIFKTKPTLDDVSIFYDIKSKNEYKIIQEIETTFEDLNQKIIFHETYNNRLTEVINKCKEMNIKYAKKNEHSIELKWSDLNKLNIKWNITDFI